MSSPLDNDDTTILHSNCTSYNVYTNIDVHTFNDKYKPHGYDDNNNSYQQYGTNTSTYSTDDYDNDDAYDKYSCLYSMNIDAITVTPAKPHNIATDKNNNYNNTDTASGPVVSSQNHSLESATDTSFDVIDTKNITENINNNNNNLPCFLGHHSHR